MTSGELKKIKKVSGCGQVLLTWFSLLFGRFCGRNVVGTRPHFSHLIASYCQKLCMEPSGGDLIIWQDEAVEMEGQPAVVTPGMKGEVISLHDGFHLDVVQGEAIPPKAIV